MRFLPNLQLVEILHARLPSISIGPVSDDLVVEKRIPAAVTRPEHIVHFFRDVHGI
jgi:hypothetical protein